MAEGTQDASLFTCSVKQKKKKTPKMGTIELEEMNSYDRVIYYIVVAVVLQLISLPQG